MNIEDELADVLKNIINSCVHPDRAARAVMVDLDPIRNVLKKYEEKKKSLDNLKSSDIVIT